MARIVIIDDDPPGAGSVIVQPFLNENPSPVSGRDSGGPAAARTVGFNLAQNAPNPFNPTTRIAFTIESDEHVTLTIHDVRGRAVATLVDQRLPSGEHSREWDGRSANGRALASGVYFYRLKTSQGTLTRKALLLN